MAPRVIALFTIVLLIVGPAACDRCDEAIPYFAINGLTISDLVYTAEGSNP